MWRRLACRLFGHRLNWQAANQFVVITCARCGWRTVCELDREL
jgi:RNase P subunit RPR2